MKVIMYLATTANGYIATPDDNVDFVSEASWESYMEIMKRVGCVIIGRRTYELMKEDEFVNDCDYIVLTSQTDLPKKAENVRFTADDPAQILASLDKEEVLICGGGKLNACFAGLLDELYLDIEPKLLGKGIKLFSDCDFEADLELVDTKKLSDQTIQLHYRVKK